MTIQRFSTTETAAPLQSPLDPSPRAVDTLRELHGLAVEARFSDPMWGALVIASMALASLDASVAVDLRKVASSGHDR